MLKVVKPEEMEDNLLKLEEAIEKFNNQLIQQEKGEYAYNLIIVGEYSRKTLDEVIRLYEEAGWVVLSCKTSSESGERGGLSGLEIHRRK